MSMRNPLIWIFVIVFDGIMVFIYFSGLAISIIEGEESRWLSTKWKIIAKTKKWTKPLTIQKFLLQQKMTTTDHPRWSSKRSELLRYSPSSAPHSRKNPSRFPWNVVFVFVFLISPHTTCWKVRTKFHQRLYSSFKFWKGYS